MPIGVYQRTGKHRIAMSEARRGRPLSDEEKAALLGSGPYSRNWFRKLSRSGNTRRQRKPVAPLKGRQFSQERRLAHSQRMTGIVKSQEWKDNLSKSLKGRKHSPERIARIVAGVAASRKKPRVMTKPELRTSELLQSMYGHCNPYVFTGDRRTWIGVTGGKRRHRNPDFTDAFGKKVIEVFGRYWHRNETVDGVVAEYRSAGLDCLVLWEDEIDSSAIDRIEAFTYPYEFLFDNRDMFGLT